ncbi:hypothetical protein [Aureispira anguillae]|uniref:Lipoprotein n=1 Tax=Aureispira anguillae TaxID=2864201 RepID=A0A915YFY2_9BACT|nr:hypothetical protein [Aureispira anguillae]BDS12418.1 hypothetical protein AsAng_0031390 [Aureispira anguillae]
MRLLSIVLLLSILSCKDEHRRKPYCGEAPHYNITAELELERQNFSFKTILYDSKLDKKRIDQLALNTLFDVGISRVDNQDFIPLKERVEDLLNKTFNKLTYIVFYYKLDLSDKVTKIGYENIKAISIYNYQERSKRYAHSLYKKEGKEFKIDADFSSLVSKLRFNDLGNIITNEIFPNEINKGYLLVKNQMEAKKHYQERKEHNNLSHTKLALLKRLNG